jgi:hypothetical protein
LPRSRKSAATPQALVPEEDRSGPKPAFDPEAYNTVARAAKLSGITLLRSNFALQLEYFSSLDKEGGPKPRYAGAFTNNFFNPKTGRASCEWNWGISVTHDRKKTLSIEVVYLLIYTGLQNCNEEHVIRYMQRVGRFATYPYFRAHVSQLNWEAGANLPMLPTIAT